MMSSGGSQLYVAFRYLFKDTLETRADLPPIVLDKGQKYNN